MHASVTFTRLSVPLCALVRMSGMGMDAMGKSSFDDMMEGMGEMHQQLDGQMPSGDPHHPTATP